MNNIGLNGHRLATFGVAVAWISNGKAGSYTWVLRKLSAMVYENRQSTIIPSVIVSDKDQARINAINSVFFITIFNA